MKADKIKYNEVKAEIISFGHLTENVCCCRAASKEIASSVPGQFITVEVTGNTGVPVLRRPFAVSYACGGEFEFLFSIRGRGTRKLTGILQKRGTLNVLGPLGNGFSAGDKKHKLLIAGGIGIAPLKRLAQDLYEKGRNVTILWGNRSASEIFGDIVPPGKERDIMFATDDGSFGSKGSVLDLLISGTEGGKLLPLSEYDIFAVGPDPMMKAVSEHVAGQGSRCQVSLETPMACGMGVCQGCAVRKRGAEGYYLVCKDGPVFFSDQIELI